jgi:Protein of unknown function (DUF3048) N-terminal domain/Protein of unknown function (DUF3048) C-terminal domain
MIGRPSLVPTLLLATALVCAACSTPAPSPTIALTQSPAAEATVLDTSSPAPSPSDTPAPSGVTAIAPLDGLAVDPTLADRLPIAVMIDDNIPARPQAGFNAASIVYQAPADGGEDRYMLVFQENDAPLVGPVRSGRPYFVRWATEYRSLFAHYGGDAKTLAYLPTINGTLIYNLDALSGSNAAFYRVSTRVAPHNAYTSTAAIWLVGLARGAPSTMVPGLPARLFGTAAPLDLRPPSGSITIPYGTGITSYAYDPTTDAYLRSVAGHAQVDAADGQRVTAMDVVVLFMALSIDPQSEPGYARPVLAQIGTGKALVFKDGKVVVGTWSKSSVGALTVFLDASGAQIPLVPGRIFIQVVPTGTNVTYGAAH